MFAVLFAFYIYLLATGLIVFAIVPAIFLIDLAKREPTSRRRAAVMGAAWVLVGGSVLLLFRSYILSTAVLVVVAIAEAVLAVSFARKPAEGGRRIGFVAILAALLVAVSPGIVIWEWPVYQFESAAARCGHEPVVAFTILGLMSGEKVYRVEGDTGYGPSLDAEHYYCSAAEAEAAGYSRQTSY